MAGEGLDYAVERVAGNAAMANPDIQMTHWKCTLSASSSAVSFVVSLSEDVHGEDAPSKIVSLALLAADLDTLSEYPDQSIWLQEMAEQTGIEDAGQGLLLAHELLTETAAEFEAAFGTDWRSVLASNFTAPVASAPRV